MACNSCGNKNYYPGIVHKIARVQRNAHAVNCSHTKEDIIEYRNKLICIMKGSAPALDKYTFSVYVSILSVAIASGNICSGKILSIKETIENYNCSDET